MLVIVWKWWDHLQVANVGFVKWLGGCIASAPVLGGGVDHVFFQFFLQNRQVKILCNTTKNIELCMILEKFNIRL